MTILREQCRRVAVDDASTWGGIIDSHSVKTTERGAMIASSNNGENEPPTK